MHPVWRFWRGISAGAWQARAESGVRLPCAKGFQALAFLGCPVAHPALQLRLDLGRFGGFDLPESLCGILAALILAQRGASLMRLTAFIQSGSDSLILMGLPFSNLPDEKMLGELFELCSTLTPHV